jgi:hypothetical protein
MKQLREEFDAATIKRAHENEEYQNILEEYTQIKRNKQAGTRWKGKAELEQELSDLTDEMDKLKEQREQDAANLEVQTALGPQPRARC